MKQKAAEYFKNKLIRIGDAQGNTDKRVFERPELTNDVKTVHISGVCGKAMSPLAGLFKESGYTVSGSDTECYPPASDFIDSLKIEYHDGFSEENIKGKDLIIIPNIFGPDNVEAKYARENKLHQMSLPEAVSEFFIKDRTSIVICGTHGKTTTTGFASHVFLTAKRQPGFLIGGVAVPTEHGIQETPFNTPVSDSKYFIIEGDEYDTAYFDKAPKFLHYKPTIAVVTSLEFDHADIYSDFNEYKQSFIFLAEELNKDGLLILNGDSEEVRSLAQHSAAPVLYYGFTENCDVTAINITVDEKGQHFDLVFKGQTIGHFDIRLFGKYNLANTLSVCAIALHEKLSTEEIQEGLKTYLGMKRRQEIKGVFKGITIIDDFAHHPTAVRETLGGIREHFPNNRIIAVFEPRSNTSRKKMFEEDYGNAFGSVDALYLSMPHLRHNDVASDFIDGQRVINTAKKARNNAFTAICVSNCDEVLEQLVPDLKEGDVVVIMSNGSFDGIHEKLISRLS
jgi:UDP-N-acetylmuramate: L-alanyl-gamma-D-glutamyl-meso-diaminopimelate ligase